MMFHGILFRVLFGYIPIYVIEIDCNNNNNIYISIIVFNDFNGYHLVN